MTSTKIQRGEGGLSLSMVSEMTGYAPTDIALISKTVAVGADLQELAVFLHACRQLRLDPLLRQAFWIRRKQKDGTYRGALQVGIDGFRAIAEGSGLYAGAEAIEHRGQIEWSYKGKTIIVPELSRATVWKVVAGHKSAFVGEAHWIEFCPASEGEQFMWARMPRHMLGKCAEAQALRRAFPAQLGSLELADDNQAADGTVSVTEDKTRQHQLAERHKQISDNYYELPDPAPEQDSEPEAGDDDRE